MTTEPPTDASWRYLSHTCRWLGTVLAPLVLAPLVLAGFVAAQEASGCVGCHREKTPGVYEQHAAGVHTGKAVGCVGCHGGDPRAGTKRAGHDPDKGYVGVSSPADASARCASCHEDTAQMKSAELDKSVVVEWRGSAHGKSLAKDGPRAATCLSCHGSHGILSRRDPRSPAHPTQVPSTCGGCHAREREHMAASPHSEALQHTGMPSCVRCHGDHRTEIPMFRAICEECHQSEDDPAREVVQHMAMLIEVADKQIEALDRVIATAEGGNPDPGRPGTKARLLGAEQKRVHGLRERVRQVSHSLDVDFLAASVHRVQNGVKAVAAIAGADLDGDQGFTDSTVTLLITAGVLLLLVLSIGLSVFMFRLGRRIRKIRSRRVVEAAS